MAVNPCGPRKITDIFRDQGIRLTYLEARFLNAILGRERLVTHQEVTEDVWPGEDGGPLTVNRILAVLTHRCRAKIRASGIGWVLENVPGWGYRIRYRPLPEARAATASGERPTSPSTRKPGP